MDLPDHHRHEDDPDEDDERDDRPGPREPGRAVEPLEDRGEEVLERLERVREPEDHARLRSSRRAGTACGRATRSTPPWLHGLQRSRRQPATIPPRTSPSSRNASIAYCEQVGWYLQVPGGVSRPNVYRQTWTSADPEPPHRRHLAEHLAHLLDEPLVAARRRPARPDPGARRARSRSRPAPRRRARPRRLAQLPLEPVAHDGGADRPRDREADAWHAVRVVLPGEPVQRERAGRDGSSLPVDRVEVPRPGQAVAALHGLRATRRAASGPWRGGASGSRWPPRVDMRARKPCLRLRRRTFG